MKDIRHPKCKWCGDSMYPVFFTEEESIVKNGELIWTGRSRKNVSHFGCACGKKELVDDDTFAGKWS